MLKVGYVIFFNTHKYISVIVLVTRFTIKFTENYKIKKRLKKLERKQK